MCAHAHVCKVCVIAFAKISSIMLNDSKTAGIVVLSVSPGNTIIFQC